VPSGAQLEEWLSFSVLVSLAYPLNPLLMQRVFAAKVSKADPRPTGRPRPPPLAARVVLKCSMTAPVPK
jgi:hypothetical protein